MTTTTEPLTDLEKKTLSLLSKSARTVAVITVREIQSELGYASPSMPHRFLSELARKGKIRLVKRGVYEIL